jgi:putative oxidoreductase
MGSLHNKTAIVTGASQGIGLATVRQLAAEGANVVAAARTVTSGMEESASRSYALDLATPEGASELMRRTLADFEGLDVLINNVGAFTARTEGFTAISDQQWLDTLQINLLSAVRAIRDGLPSLLERQGAIVNIASINASVPQPPVVDYAAAKAALLNLTQSLAEEFGPQGIRVNAISPGPTRTPAWESQSGFGAALARASGQSLEAFLEGFPGEADLSTGRMTEPDEVAAVVALLASGKLRNANGTNIVVDGGQDKST